MLYIECLKPLMKNESITLYDLHLTINNYMWKKVW